MWSATKGPYQGFRAHLELYNRSWPAGDVSYPKATLATSAREFRRRTVSSRHAKDIGVETGSDKRRIELDIGTGV